MIVAFDVVLTGVQIKLEAFTQAAPATGIINVKRNVYVVMVSDSYRIEK
jgi:hypothetical protein